MRMETKPFESSEEKEEREGEMGREGGEWRGVTYPLPPFSLGSSLIL